MEELQKLANENNINSKLLDIILLPVQNFVDGDHEADITYRRLIYQSLEEVKAFFFVQKSTSIEAEKFFNYFQSNGWKVGGRAPMKDWHAAARNWILNTSKYSGKVEKAISFSPEKNYAEPL